MRESVNRRMFIKGSSLGAVGSALVGMGCASGTSETCASRPGRAKAAGDMPTVRIGDLTVSRFILGGNPFSGHAHQPGDAGKQMRDWYSVKRIKDTLNQAADEGVNTFLGRGDKHVMRMLQEYWNEEGRIEHWIAQSAPEFGSMSRNIGEVAGYGGRGMYIQGAHVDRLFAQGKLEDVRPWLDEIKERGMLAGVGSHRPDILRIVQDKGWPADFYMQCFYNITEHGDKVYPAEDREKAVRTIRELEKPTIAFKILAAGRNDPEEAFSFAFKNIKPGDPVCVGIFMKDRPHEIKQNAALTRKYG
ncbi:MAG: hypothetical protein ABIH23_19925 [bacterium]